MQEPSSHDIHGHYCRRSAASLDQPFVDTAAYWLAGWLQSGTFLRLAEAHFAQIQQPGKHEVSIV